MRPRSLSMNSSINFYDRNNNMGNNSLITASITNNLSNTSRQPHVPSREKPKQQLAQHTNSQTEKASRENSKTNSTHLRKENSFYTNGSSVAQQVNTSNLLASQKLNIGNSTLDAANLISNSIYGNSSNISLISNNPSTQQFKNSSRAVLAHKQLNSQTPGLNHANHAQKVDCLTSSGKWRANRQI